MTNKHNIARELFNLTLLQESVVLKDVINRKDYKDIAREIVKDFPLLFKVDTTYKKIEFRATKDIQDNLIEKKLNLALESMAFYTDRIYDAYSITKSPLLKAIEVPKNYLSSSLLTDDELYDFIGKPQLSAYSKTIKILISNNGKYLNDREYNIDDLPLEIKDLIELFEEWYFNTISNKDVTEPNEILLDNSTSQVLFPYEDNYISISPVHSLGFVKRVIQTNQNIIFNKDKKDKNKSNFIKITTWSSMVGKVQNISLNAPSSKKGIFLAEAPSYNNIYAKKILFNENLNIFIKKELENLVYRSDIFKNMIISFYNYLTRLIKNNELIVSKTMIKQDDMISTIFKFFSRQKQNAEKYQTLDVKEFISIFIDNVFNLKVYGYPNGVTLDYRALDTFYNLLYLDYEKEILNNDK